MGAYHTVFDFGADRIGFAKAAEAETPQMPLSINQMVCVVDNVWRVLIHRHM